MSNIKIKAALGLDVLTLSVQRKKNLSSLCVIKSAKLQTLLDNPKLYHDLKRRINQKEKQKNLDDEETLTNMKFECINTLALSWPDALENVIEKQNVGNYMHGPLSDEKLLMVGSFLEESTAVPVKLVLEHFEIDKKHERNLIKQIIRLCPVMHIRISQSIIENL